MVSIVSVASTSWPFMTVFSPILLETMTGLKTVMKGHEVEANRHNAYHNSLGEN